MAATRPEPGVRRALAALELAAVRHLGAVRRRLGVSEEELAALLHLAHHGDAPQGRLAGVTALSRSGTGALVQRLERAGLVERRTDPQDRRLRHVALSPAGREHLERAYAPLGAAAAALPAQAAVDVARLAQLLDDDDAVAEAGAAPLGARPAAAAPGTPLGAASPREPIWRRWA